MNSNGIDGGLMGAEALPKKDKGVPRPPAGDGRYAILSWALI